MTADDSCRLTLVTDDPTSVDWLSYVAQVFGEVTGLILAVHAAGHAASIKISRGETIAIHYAARPPRGWSGVFIPRLMIGENSAAAEVICNGPLSRFSMIRGAAIPITHTSSRVLKEDGLIRSAEGVTLEFDLLQNAFLRLSCALERRSENPRKGSHGYLPSGFSLAELAKPIVNYLFELLCCALRGFVPAIALRSLPSGQVLSTHDIDAVHKTWLKGGKQVIMNLRNMVRCALKGRWPEAGRMFGRSVTLLFGRDDFDQLPFWEELGAALPALPLFHVYVRTRGNSRRKGWRAHAIDPDYDVVRDIGLRQQLRDLKRRGFGVGLHGSYDSFDDRELLAEEKRLLEDIIESPCEHIRQHWLHFSFQRTWRCQEEVGFAIDTGFGFNNAMGFRSGLAHPHHPWDEKNRKPHRIKIIPMVAMDATLFDYLLMAPEQARLALQELVRETRIFGGCVNINWHTHGASRAYNWHQDLLRFHPSRQENAMPIEARTA